MAVTKEKLLSHLGSTMIDFEMVDRIEKEVDGLLLDKEWLLQQLVDNDVPGRMHVIISPDMSNATRACLVNRYVKAGWNSDVSIKMLQPPDSGFWLQFTGILPAGPKGT